MQLDSTNKRILHEIEYNARISDKELAKITRKSRDSVAYRIKKLKENGYLNSQGCFVDYTKLGLTSFKIYLTISSNYDEYQKLIAWGRSKKEVFCMYEAQTGWHVAFAFFAKDLMEYELIQQELFATFGHIISKHYLTQMVRAFIYTDSRLVNIPKKRIPIFGEVINNSIDKKDVLLLKEYLSDSSQSYVDLTKKVDLSIEPVIRRTKQLVKKDVIRFFTSEINYNKLGYQIYKLFISVKYMDAEKEAEFQSYLESCTELRNLIYLVGPYRFEVEFIISNHDEIFDIVQKIQQKYHKFVQNIEYTIFHSEEYYPAGLNLE